MFGKGQRTDLDDDDAVILAPRIREEIQVELKRLIHHDPSMHKILGKL